MTPLIRAIIDATALKSNLRRIRAVAPGSRVMAVVKANAYGHGLVPTALALSEADAFAVARLEEGIALREAGVSQTIILLEGVFSAEQLAEAAQRRFEIVVHDPLQIALLERATGAHRFVIWVKVDTGMNRLGFRAQELAPVLARLRALAPAPAELRVMTHLARADERDCPMTALQIERFDAVTATLGLVRSIGNSAGILGWPSARGEWVRPGLALYGISPFPGEASSAVGLIPAMTLASTVIAVRRVPRGESVGYGGTWTAPRESRIAIVAGGYGDGLPRSLKTGTPVLVNGRRAPLVGRVAMDMIAADVTELPEVEVGTRCVLWGRGLEVTEVAQCAGTIAYELLCGVRARVPREPI
ncbi:MAG TPA: alanine racemase [Steroidobacteraceae bacterium]|nr:alanine racemase [Steroidobacteraceae bacterium]